MSNDPITHARLFDVDEVQPKSLAGRFTYPPFSVLDTRAGWWQNRKQEWIDMGLRSEEGRTARMVAKTGNKDEVSQKLLALSGGQSIFDPVLCELVYRWFCPPGGRILDPFAGGSVRGLVAGHLKHRYTGIDLSATQCEANERQAVEWIEARQLRPTFAPTWINSDSHALLCEETEPGDYQADLVFSCPPYHDLEVYSDDPADLSNMPWATFEDRYREIIAGAIDDLADHRFAVFVIGEIRARTTGTYRNFMGATIDAFENAGASYYNELILVNVAGTLPLRAAKQFIVSRKIGKTHQTVLVFVKGDPKKAAAMCDPGVMDFLGDVRADNTDPQVPVEHG